MIAIKFDYLLLIQSNVAKKLYAFYQLCAPRLISPIQTARTVIIAESINFCIKSE